MAEKEYPKYEEESGMAKEPVAAVAYQREMISDIEDNIPIAGPDSWEKAMADIEQSERDFAEGKYLNNLPCKTEISLSILSLLSI